jgi:hypothetical protein
MTLEGARGLRSVTKIGQNYFVARFRPVRIKITKKEDDQPMRKGMQTAILLLLVGACLQTGKAQSCTAGNLEFSESIAGVVAAGALFCIAKLKGAANMVIARTASTLSIAHRTCAIFTTLGNALFPRNERTARVNWILSLLCGHVGP